MTRPLLPLAAIAALALTCAALPAWSATKVAKPAASPALAELSEEQLANADRVLVGKSACEFNQAVDVSEAPEKKGYFHLSFRGKTYVMAPEPTTTGAVRLENKKDGVVWLQIPSKSMLMNAKVGQRMVDDCKHPNQHT